MAIRRRVSSFGMVVCIYLLVVSTSATKLEHTRKESTISSNELNFLVVADWGGLPVWPYYTPDEISVSRRMGVIGKEVDAQFILALGDNFYETGVEDADDKRFKHTFEDVFTAPSLHVPWYVVAGNHDHRGNVSGQIAYSKKSERWNFPSEYYRLDYKIPGSGGSIVFLMIDTVILCGGAGEDVPGCDLKGPDDPVLADIEWQWIEKELQQSKDADYIIVAGHFPIWSIGSTGSNYCLVDRLRPLLLKYNVTAYFAGHDHNLQHIRESNTSLDVFVIGSGNIINPSVEHMDQVPAEWMRFFYAELGTFGGFSYVSSTPDKLTLTFASGAGNNNLYSVDMMPRHKPRI